MWGYIKRHYIIFSILLIAIVGIIIYSTGGEELIEYETTIVEKQDLIQEVSVTGHLRPYKSVDLGFERGGRIMLKGAEVGDKVAEGAELMKVDDSDLQASLAAAKASIDAASAMVQGSQAGVQLAKAEANSQLLQLQTEQAQLVYNQKEIAVEEARLEDLDNASTDEQVRVYQTRVENASVAVSDAETNLENVLAQVESNLDDYYSGSLVDSENAVDTAIDALISATDIQYEYYSSNDLDGIAITQAKEEAMQALFDERNAGRFNSSTISTLNDGLVKELDSYSKDSPQEELDGMLDDTLVALRAVKSTLDAIPIKSKMSATDVAEIQTQKVSINTEISLITNLQQSIETQRVANQNTVSTAEAQLNEAISTYQLAQDELNLTKTGASDTEKAVQEAVKDQTEARYDVQSSNVNRASGDLAVPQAKINQAVAGVASDQAQLSKANADLMEVQSQLLKTLITAPFPGVIAKMEGEVGELASSGVPVITLISDGHFKIEAFVPEVDIAKIQVNDKARFTLDAIQDQDYEATVLTVDPGETLIEGVTTYKVTLEFFTDDDRIRSNMTANIDILTDKKEDVIVVLQRAIIQTNGDKIIRVLRDGKMEEVKIKTGITGNNGLVEVVEGLQEGDEVVTFIKED